MAMYPCLSLPSLSFPSVSGAVCSFDSQYAGIPLKAHTVDINAVQSGSGTPSPDNVRPISGWSAITITANSVPTVISIGSTIYGGNYDAVSGVLTVTHEGLVFDGSSDENWVDYTVSGTVYYYIENVLTGINILTNRDAPICLCNIYKEESAILNSSYLSNCSDNSYCNQATPFIKRLWVINRSITSLTDFKQSLSDDNLVIVYPLNTPTTIQLPPVRVETLGGVNNVFADTGDTTLQYIKFG